MIGPPILVYVIEGSWTLNVREKVELIIIRKRERKIMVEDTGVGTDDPQVESWI